MVPLPGTKNLYAVRRAIKELKGRLCAALSFSERTNSDSFAMFAAIRLASSLLSNFAADEGQTPDPGIKHCM